MSTNVFQHEWVVGTRGKGLYEITDTLTDQVAECGIVNGLVSVFCKHTSCSLVLMENADPSARRDLEYWFEKLVPENDGGFTHTLEGADDMPSHIKMALTRSSETLPLTNGRPQLGTWQGLFLWEHRTRPHQRSLALTVVGV